MKRMYPYLQPYLWAMALGLTIKFVGTIMDLLLPWLLSYLIDNVVPTRNIRLVLLYGSIMIICSVIAVTTNITANRMASRVARDATRTIRHDLFSKISYLSCHQVDTFTIPSLESRLTSDTYNIHQVIGKMQRLGVRAPILLMGGIIVTLTLEPVLTLVLLSILPVLACVVYRISKKGIPLYTKLQQAVDKMVLDVRENTSGIRVIKALSKMDYEKEQFSIANGEVTKRETKAATVMAASNPLMNLFLNMGLTLVIVVGAYRVNSGLTQPGKIIAFLTYFTIILNAMLSITRMFVMYSKGSASAGRIAEILDAPEDLAVLPEDTIESPYHVTFDNVCFSYNRTKNNLENISFQLKKGETLGILGATGCGKSTIINLLIRFYDPDSGEIRINGQNVNTIPFEQLHRKFGIVFQNDVLFAETIEENIDFGRALDRSEIDAAARYAQAAGFIDELEDGLDYRLTSRGTNLSGGQKQRVLISRALAAHPEILVLDDSSSALDYKTDAHLRQAIGEHFQETTTIIVAQRVSSILHADHIMVLDEGKILGYGTHEELMETCLNYREIAISQMGRVTANA